MPDITNFEYLTNPAFTKNRVSFADPTLVRAFFDDANETGADRPIALNLTELASILGVGGGGNQVTASTALPSPSGRAEGDVHIQYDSGTDSLIVSKIVSTAWVTQVTVPLGTNAKSYRAAQVAGSARQTAPIPSDLSLSSWTVGSVIYRSLASGIDQRWIANTTTTATLDKEFNPDDVQPLSVLPASPVAVGTNGWEIGDRIAYRDNDTEPSGLRWYEWVASTAGNMILEGQSVAFVGAPVSASVNMVFEEIDPLSGVGEDGHYHWNVLTGDVTGPKATGSWPTTGNLGNTYTAPVAPTIEPDPGDAGTLLMTTARSSGNLSVIATSSSGFYTVKWPDATITTHATGAANHALSTSGNALIWPSNGDNTAIVGSLTSITLNNQSLTALDITPTSALQTLVVLNDTTLSTITGSATHTSLLILNLQNNSALTEVNFPVAPLPNQVTLNNCTLCTSVNVSSATISSITIHTFPACTSLALNTAALQYFDLTNVGITSFNASSYTSLLHVNILSCEDLITYTHRTALLNLYLQNNQNLAGTLDVSNSPSLANLVLTDNPALASLIVDNCPALTQFTATNNSALTQIRAVGCALTGGGIYGSSPTPNNYASYNIGTSISSNLLDDTALDQFYTDLLTTSFTYTSGSPYYGLITAWDYGVINVNGNPGASSDSKGIATAKGYVVIGTA